MKKLAILLVIALSLLFVACNVDGDNGLYMKVATSIAPSGIYIKQFVGFYADTFYFLSDDALYKTAKTAGGTVKFTGTAGKKFNAAYTNDYSTVYLLDTYGKLWTLDTSDPANVPVASTTYTDTYTGLSFNGYLYGTSGFYYLGGSNPNDLIAIDLTNGHVMFSGDSFLYITGENAKIHKAGSDTAISTVSGFEPSSQTKNHALGFYQVSASKYIVCQLDGSNYKAYSVEGSVKTQLNVDGSLGYPQDYYPGGYPMVEYVANKILLRTKSTYLVLNYASPAKQEDIGTWAASIKDLSVVSMVKLTDNEIAILSAENGIRIVNLSSRTMSEDIL